MARYGIDRPDLRFGLELTELSDLLAETEFKVFRGVIEGGGVVKGINAGARDVPRSVLDGSIAASRRRAGLGLSRGRGLALADRQVPQRRGAGSAQRAPRRREGDLLLVVADRPETANAVLAQLRLDLAERFELIDPCAERFCWIAGWPMFRLQRGRGMLGPVHHPFTAPDGEFDPEHPGEARALAYDVVWNGQELGGGSIRTLDPDPQQLRALETIRMAREGRATSRVPARGVSLRSAAAPAGSPTGSTAGCSVFCTPTRSATRSPSRRPPPGPTRSPAPPPRSTRRSFASWG